MTENKTFDVIIIGGSYAGLSAAMALGRSLRNILVIDSGKPCNWQTPHSHNFLTQDGKPPQEIAALARQQVAQYETVQFYNGIALTGTKTKNVFEIVTQSGEIFKSRKLIFATGIKDEMPDIRGFSDCWGISVIHCPYCHGYEYRNRKTGIMANSDRAFHLSSLVNNLTTELTVLTNGKAEFTNKQTSKLKKHNIQIIETTIAEIEHEDGHIKNLIFIDNTSISLDALYASLPFVQHTDIPKSLGCALTEQGFIKVDNFQKTTVAGVFACGDNAGQMRSVANAVLSGNLTGAMVNKELTDEHF